VLKVGILANSENSHTQALLKAFSGRNVAVQRFALTHVSARVGLQPLVGHQGTALEQLDAILVRGFPGGSLEQVIYRMDVLHRLERLGVKVINSPGAIEKTVDKFYTSALLDEAGILTPKTVVTEKFSEAITAFREMGDVVVKPIFGSLGNGMVRITDEEVAYRTFRALELGKYVFYLQEYIPHDNQDIRALVIGGRVVAAMLRKGNGWKTNIAKGAVAEPFALSDQLTASCIRAARILGADYVGVDILPGEDNKFYVAEVNSIPGWTGLQGITEVDIAGELAAYVIEVCCRNDSVN
jgi:RimK family alpha-L-glutamate ligase